MDLTLPDRETLQCKLSASHDTENPLPDIDRRILELLLDAPLKRINPCTEKFILYQTTMDVYYAALSGRVSSHNGVQLLQNHNKRQIYDLLFNAISHYSILEDVLVESSFYSRFFNLHDAGIILYMMLYDYQNSNFTIPFHRLPDEENRISDIIPDIAQALNMHKIKLNGTLARMCVKSSVPIISELIQNEVLRESCLASIRSPCYARVNVLKGSSDIVLKKLQADGFRSVECPSSLRNHTKTFCIMDDDFLAFSSDCRKLLDVEPLVHRGYLALQDLRSYRFVKKMEKTIRSCTGDIVVTEPNSGYEIAHIATLLGFQGKVFVYDSNYKEGAPLARTRMQALSIPNVIFTNTSFACINGDEDILKDVEIIFCIPETFPSSKDNKTDLAMQEGDRLLPYLVKSDDDGGLVLTDIFELNACLSTALALRKAKTIVYKTMSEFQVYNENVVRQQVEEFNELAKKKQYLQYEIASITSYSKMDCFSAIIVEESKPEEAASTVIARAIALGLIKGDGLGTCNISEDKCKDSPPKQKKFVKPFKASLATTISYQQKCKPKRKRDTRGPSKPTFKL